MLIKLLANPKNETSVRKGIVPDNRLVRNTGRNNNHISVRNRIGLSFYLDAYIAFQKKIKFIIIVGV
jgi:hypothetical protein